MNTRKMLIGEIMTFLAETGMAESALGRQAVSDPSLMIRLRNGRGMGIDKLDRIRAFMRDYRADAEKAQRRAAKKKAAA